MKLVIDIPEEIYMDIKEDVRTKVNTFEHIPFLHEVISVGAPLPEGHGRIVDADLLSTIFTDQYPKNYMNEPELSGTAAHFSLRHILQVLSSESFVPTIIETDKAESEDKGCR